jgi:hypothetical protein
MRIESDLRDEEPRVIRGVRGAKSRPFSRRFKNAAEMERWFDSEAASDVTIDSIERA